MLEKVMSFCVGQSRYFCKSRQHEYRASIELLEHGRYKWTCPECFAKYYFDVPERVK